MAVDAPRIVEVRCGRVQARGSWLYAWVDVNRAAVVYVGGTGFDPELRAHIHLTDEDPELGRVKAQVPNASKGDFDVLAFPLPDGVDRGRAKQALLAALASGGLFGAAQGSSSDSDPLTEPMVAMIISHLSKCRNGSSRLSESPS